MSSISLPKKTHIDRDGHWSEPEGIGCQWYALCANAADGLLPHPALGPVPACRRCAGKHDMLDMLVPIGKDTPR